jgi:arginase
MVASGPLRQRSGRLTLLGAPVDGGANIPGSFLGPSALRMIGLASMLKKVCCDVIDYGDLAPVAVAEPSPMHIDERAHKASEVTRWLPSLSEAAYELARGEHLPVFLGGDHSLSMGTINGIARSCAERGNELFLLWLDAHPDFNTPATSPSGNLHGMSLAFLCGESGFEHVIRVPACKAVDPDNVFLFGIRSVDAGEGEVLRSRGVNMVDMREIRQNGLTTSIRRVLETVAKRDGVLHVSLDADFVDPLFTPGVNVPVSGGVTYAEAHLTMLMLNESGLVASLDVAELNPLLDTDGRSTRVIAELVACLFDQKAKSRHDYSRQEGRYGHNAA